MIDIVKRNITKALGLSAIGIYVKATAKGRSVTTLTFNYTERYIGDVTVNGTWTGGADAFGMGGGAEGLLAPADIHQVAIIKVKWSVGSYYSVADDSYNRVPIEEKTTQVEIARPYPRDPTYLVIHFYADGHVEAELEAARPKRRIPPPPGYHR